MSGQRSKGVDRPVRKPPVWHNKRDPKKSDDPKKTAAATAEEELMIEGTLEELADQENVQMPPIKEMLKATLVGNWADHTEETEVVRRAAQDVIGENQGDIKSELVAHHDPFPPVMSGKTDVVAEGEVINEEEWARLVNDPTSSSTSSPAVIKNKEKMLVERKDTSGHFPEESIASARELEDVRESITVLETRMLGIEDQLLLMMKERQILPDKLEHLNNNVTRQLSDMLDKLHMHTEQNLPSSAVEAAASELINIKEDMSAQLKGASSNLVSAPSKNSPLTNVTGSLRPKRKRFAPLK